MKACKQIVDFGINRHKSSNLAGFKLRSTAANIGKPCFNSVEEQRQCLFHKPYFGTNTWSALGASILSPVHVWKQQVIIKCRQAQSSKVRLYHHTKPFPQAPARNSILPFFPSFTLLTSTNVRPEKVGCKSSPFPTEV